MFISMRGVAFPNGICTYLVVLDVVGHIITELKGKRRLSKLVLCQTFYVCLGVKEIFRPVFRVTKMFWPVLRVVQLFIPAKGIMKIFRGNENN